MHYLIGVDEVGRGALAGPVAVSAIAVPRQRARMRNLKDSKRLTALQRDRWFRSFKSEGLLYAVSYVGPRTIDRINIRQATDLGVARCLKKLAGKLNKGGGTCRISLDGGLSVPAELPPSPRLRRTSRWRAQTIVHGDEIIQEIMAASIVAKVSRDRLMARLHKKYPRYGFDVHKGYGTKKHYRALRKHGISPVHRKSFLKNITPSLRLPDGQ